MPLHGKEPPACRAVFHVDEEATWPLVLTNAQNLCDACRDAGRGCLLEIVANGPAVQALTRAQAAAHGLEGPIAALHARGVAVTACANALAAHHIPWDTLLTYIDVVPAGVVELIEKQRDGFAYIKP